MPVRVPFACPTRVASRRTRAGGGVLVDGTQIMSWSGRYTRIVTKDEILKLTHLVSCAG